MERDSKDAYQQLIETTFCPVFMQPWWLDVTCGPNAWGALISADDQGMVSAAFPYHCGAELGVWNWAKMPHLTPYTGLLVSHPTNMTSASTRQAFTLAQWSHIASQLPKSYCNLTLHPDFSPNLPWRQIRLRSEQRVTYSLPMNGEKDALWNGMQSRARGVVRKARKLLQIEPADDVDDIFRMLEMSFGRQQLKVPISKAFLSDLISAIHSRGAGLITKAVDDQGRIHACNVVVKDERYAYNLVTGSDQSLHQSGAVSLLIWDAIETLLGQVEYYDFEGGMMEGIASFYASFGALRRPYTRIFRSANRMTDALFTLMGRF